MSLNVLRVALQGLFRLTPVALAVQGLIDDLGEAATTPPSGRAKGHTPPFDMKAYVEAQNRAFARSERIRKDDQLAVEFIMALMQSEVLHGTI